MRDETLGLIHNAEKGVLISSNMNLESKSPSASNKKLPLITTSNLRRNAIFDISRSENNLLEIDVLEIRQTGNHEMELISKSIEEGAKEIDEEDKSKLEKINSEIQQIKMKLYSLKGKPITEEKKSVLQIIFPQEYLDKKKWGAKRSNEEGFSLSKFKSKYSKGILPLTINRGSILYNNGEEIVKRLKYFERGHKIKEPIHLTNIQNRDQNTSFHGSTLKSNNPQMIKHFSLMLSFAANSENIKHNQGIIKTSESTTDKNEVSVSRSQINDNKTEDLMMKPLKRHSRNTKFLKFTEETTNDVYFENTNTSQDDEADAFTIKNKRRMTLNFFTNNISSSNKLTNDGLGSPRKIYSPYDDEQEDIDLINYNIADKEDNISKANRQTYLAMEERDENMLAEEVASYKSNLKQYSFLCEGLAKINKRLNEIIVEKDALTIVLEKQIELYQKADEYKVSMSVNRSNKHNKPKHNTGPTTYSEEDASIKSQRKMLLNKLKDQETALLKEIKHATYIKNSYKQDISSIQEKMQASKLKITKLKSDLEVHYHQLLIEGIDTRSSGLTWIMLAIWKLGGEVFMSYMPRYLDSNLIQYFFLKAHKEIEMIKTQNLLTQLKEMVRVFRGKDYRRQKKQKIKKYTKFQIKKSLAVFKKGESFRQLKDIHFRSSNLIDESSNTNYEFKVPVKQNFLINKSKLRDIRLKCSRFKLANEEPLPEIKEIQILDEISEEDINVRNLKGYFVYKAENKMEIGSSSMVSYVEELEKISHELKEDIESMKNETVDRVCNEYLTNDYERTFRVSISMIFSALVGQHNVEHELKRFAEKRKSYYKSLVLCRSFNAFKDKKNGQEPLDSMTKAASSSVIKVLKSS